MEGHNTKGGISTGETIYVVIPEEGTDEGIEFKPPPMKYPFTREELIELYYEQGLSGYQIGKLRGCDARKVFRWMERYKIPRRSPSDASINYGMQKHGTNKNI